MIQMLFSDSDRIHSMQFYKITSNLYNIIYQYVTFVIYLK